MTDPAPAQSGESLASRIPGHMVIEELLRMQPPIDQRSKLARLVGVTPLTKDGVPWFKGALGEITVGKLLKGLGSEWTILHAVPVGSGTSDIDHVLIGPGGVLTLNTKNHSGQDVWVAARSLLVGGQKTRHIPNAEHEASRAAKLLSAATGQPVHVTPVLVIINPKTLRFKEKPQEVNVLTSGELLRWLKKREPVLTPEQVARIAAEADKPRTWHRSPVSHQDPAVLRESFTALNEAVRTARIRRIGWSLLLLAGIAAALSFAVPFLTGLVFQALVHR